MGSSGAGKSWLACRLAAALELTHVELDAIHHGPGWSALPPDGSYETKGGDLVRERADTVIWLDFPRMTVILNARCCSGRGHSMNRSAAATTRSATATGYA